MTAGRWSVLMAMGVMGTVVRIPAAHAAFPFPTCSTSPAFDPPIPVNIGAREFDPKPENPPGGPTDGTKYALNTRSSWNLYTNPNVVKIQPYYGFFETEAGFDVLRVIDSTGTLSYSGNLNASTSPVAASTVWQPQLGLGIINELQLSWTSDVSIANNLPPAFTQVAVQCNNAVTNPFAPFQINLGDRTQGLLIKTGDVIYFKMSQPANTPMVISLDAKAASAGADFDLFASPTVQLPDGATATWSSTSTDTSEAIDIPVSATPRSIFVAVHSFAGAGQFALHQLVQNPSERMSLAVCPVGFTPSAAQQTTITSFLKQGAMRFLAVTNGNVWLKSFNVTAQTASCTSACSVCLLSGSGTTSHGSKSPSPNGCGQTTIGGGNWGGGGGVAWLYAHESSHSCIGEPDEYEPPPAGAATPMVCGHTIMSNHGYARFWCSIAHCEDGQASDPDVCTTSGANDWDIFTAGTHYHWGPNFSALGVTADPTDYFNNQSLQAMTSVHF
jgi:hypothetical protein